VPRYRFHVRNDTSFIVDQEGIELPDLEAMRTHAIAAIADIVADELRQGKDDIHLAVMVDGDEDERIANFQSSTKLAVSERPFAK
jgi:hypothetical protein